jgi:hypothetical protein
MNLTPIIEQMQEEKIASIIADCKLAGTSANETTRQVLDVVHKMLSSTAHAVHEASVAEERKRIWGEIVRLADDYTGELNTHLDDIDKIIRKQSALTDQKITKEDNE